MPADHGTPNTGDERDREVEAVARALTDYPDEWEEHDEGDKDVFRRMAVDAIAAVDRARSPQGEDHEAGLRAARNAYYGIPLEAEVPANASLAGFEYAIAAYLARVSPSRDGTVAVEDVRDVLLRIGERVMTFGGFQRTPRGEFWVARDDVLRLVDELLDEFGVSERTERIHDQATKEKR